MKRNRQKNTRLWIAYYGLLQSLHLIVLIRAGIILFFYKEIPFPIFPPPDGWHAQTMPFMYGLAGMDVIGILMGIIFAYQTLVKGEFNRILGLISLTIFITGAIVFAVGTYASGAWGMYPFAYGVMAVLFIPVPFLYIRILTSEG